MVRLKEVAAQAGVSMMTVSKALRDAPDISAATKTRIRQIVEEMGYVPDVLAQGLRTRKSSLLGVVVPSFSDPFFAAVLAALEEHTLAQGQDLLVAQTLARVERETLALRRFLLRRVDGLYVAPVYRLGPSAPVYDELRNSRRPVVILGAAAPFCEGFSTIDTDDLAAATKAVHYVAAAGHRQIAFFAGPTAAPWAKARREGYARALREAGLPENESLVFSAGATWEDGQNAALQMVNEGTRPTAIVAATDAVALGAIAILQQQGWRIPQDVWVLGFGNSIAGQHSKVPLTTVNASPERWGAVAAQMMRDLVRGARPHHRLIPSELVLRETTLPGTAGETFKQPTSGLGSTGERRVD